MPNRLSLRKKGSDTPNGSSPHGPGDGTEGIARNLALAKTLRETNGEDFEFMFDAFMGWDLNYAVAWAKRAEQYRPRWIEEAFPPDKIASFVAADPEWCGGVSELVKICTLASIHDVHVIPHGHSIHAALHVVASQSPMTCPLVEYLIGKMDSYYFFEQHEPRPVQGKFALPDRPGFGIELDPAKVEKQTAFVP